MVRILPALLLASFCSHAQWRVMPVPASIRAGAGRMEIRQGFTIPLDRDDSAEPRLGQAVERLRDRIALLTGTTPLSIPGQMGLSVHVKGLAKPVQAIDEDESYRLEITSTHALLTAPNVLGVMHGLQTFYQLIENTGQGWSVPAVTIDDRPRFPWRGLHLDVSRHFMPLEVVLRTLDGMEAVKLNVFHWHLSDDQGFRVESKRLPRLHELGSDGNYYTQEQVRGVIAYARDRGIRVVPEFDIPGHAASWLTGYPELAAGPGPFHIIRTWGLNEPTMDPAKPEVYDFLDTFIGEMGALFPDAYFHIGGDEVNGRQWTANTTDIPAFMKAHGFTDLHELHAWFNQQVEKIVTKHGKRMEGWDEILNPALPKDIVIQSWRGARFLTEAARLGYQGILSSGYYLDHVETSAKLYPIDPIGGLVDSLSPVQRQRILGGEACMWTEYVSAENVDTRIWPRAAVVAERLWSPPAVRDLPDMYRRLAIIDGELDRLGLRHNSSYRTMLERLAGSSNIEPLQVLTDVLEPGGLGVRLRATPPYTQSTPLNRLVDVARPDSSVARHFSDLVDRYLTKRTDLAVRDEIHRWLTLWAGNDAKLRPLIARQQALQEAAPVSSALAGMAAAALAVPKPHTPIVTKPISEIYIAVTPAINRLIAGRR
jgi:hexosaminidase